MASNTRDLQILLMGKTGMGKSATGNTILAAKKFKSQSSSLSVTQSVQKEFNTVDGRKITVVDTPGVCDTDEEPETTLAKIASAIINCPDGYDAFVIVMRHPMKLTKEEREALQHLEQLFGKDIYKYTIGIFTNGSTFEHQQREQRENGEQVTTFEEEIFKDEFSGKKGALGPVARKFKGGVVLFDNLEKDEQKKKAMVSELISNIDHLLHCNGNKRYDSHIFENIRLQKEKLETKLNLDMSKMKLDVKKEEADSKTSEMLYLLKDRLQDGVISYLKVSSGCTIL